MLAACLDAFWDSLAALPWLLVIYVVFEFLEGRYEGSLKRLIAGAKAFGPLVGALLGCIPQCGFSVVASALYCHRSITLGTLLSVYLSTSDEAVPIILAQPDKIGILAPLLLFKVIIALIAGFAVDLLFPRLGFQFAQQHSADCRCIEEVHCCAHKHNHAKSSWSVMFLSPLRHALQISLFILVVSLILNLVILQVGEGRISEVFFQHSLWQPLLAVLVGLIPNCAASVVITQIFLQGGISFGSAIAGLCASAGLGIIVLFKEAPSVLEAMRIIGLLAGISFLAGLITNLFF